MISNGALTILRKVTERTPLAWWYSIVPMLLSMSPLVSFFTFLSFLSNIRACSSLPTHTVTITCPPTGHSHLQSLPHWTWTNSASCAFDLLSTHSTSVQSILHSMLLCISVRASSMWTVTTSWRIVSSYTLSLHSSDVPIHMCTHTSWNSLPLHLRLQTISWQLFQSRLKTPLFKRAYIWLLPPRTIEEWTYLLIYLQTHINY